MDSVAVSEAVDVGSIPAARTRNRERDGWPGITITPSMKPLKQIVFTCVAFTASLFSSAFAATYSDSYAVTHGTFYFEATFWNDAATVYGREYKIDLYDSGNNRVAGYQFSISHQGGGTWTTTHPNNQGAAGDLYWLDGIDWDHPSTWAVWFELDPNEEYTAVVQLTDNDGGTVYSNDWGAHNTTHSHIKAGVDSGFLCYP